MKKFFKRLWTFIKMLFTNPETWIDENVKPSIQLVQNIKAAVDSPIGDLITGLIPGQWDNTLKERFSQHLELVITLMQGSTEVFENNTTWETRVLKFIEWLKTLTPTVRAAIYAKLASRLAKANAGEKDAIVKNNSVDLLTQVVYSKLKQAVNEDELQPVNDTPVLPVYNGGEVYK